MLDLKPIVHAILEEYVLPKRGIHGLAHWARVLETGIRLAKITGANVEVVQLFSIFHDSQRVTESTDPSHGIRGAILASELRGKLYDLDEDDFDLLFVACVGHMENQSDDDPTVQTCWDADRLDFGRVGLKIAPSWLGATTLENPSIMNWAQKRSKARIIPNLIQRDWGIKTDRWTKAAKGNVGREYHRDEW
jgi:uncharacterized protein